MILIREPCPCVQEDLFQLPGLYTEVAVIRDSLDTGTPDKLRIFFASIRSITVIGCAVANRVLRTLITCIERLPDFNV